MISRFFIDRPVLANVLALFFVLIGLVALLQLPTAAISERRPADRAGHNALPGRERQDAGRHRRPADRAEGQRRREHALHAVDQRQRRHLHV